MREAKRSDTLKRKGYLTVRNTARDSIQMDILIIKQGIESYLCLLEKQLPGLKLRFKMANVAENIEETRS